ncbi:hypothetical protein C1E24_12735 [Pseudoalteromonas phenolica]|uniref:Peptidase S8/S53 domain-containing protein n=1 Tax=Pseudoalteromonas phenolica TaxID=161398 RepID=A0A5R9Q062_9GAMM|nr:S8/S53 family peptidase [Pseudoalteromonas phenolica]TLX46530.1 hypothetical protein C1E24_12735 [Pseudoalteromonas phenolica]
MRLLICCLVVIFLSACQLVENEKQQAITFKNSNHKVQLSALEGQPNHYSSNLGLQFIVTGDLLALVKPFAKTQLSQVIGVDSFNTIATMSNNEIVLIKTSSNNLQEMINQLEAIEGVDQVQPDHYIKKEFGQVNKPASSTQNNALPMLDLPSPNQCQEPLHSVRVALIDNGFDFRHVAFRDTHVLLHYDADNLIEIRDIPNKRIGHGTAMAGVILAKNFSTGEEGIAPASEIIAIEQASSKLSSVILGFSVARMMHADIVNCSWLMEFKSDLLVSFIKDWHAQENTVFIVTAAGNGSKDACLANKLSLIPEVLTIGSINSEKKLSTFSNYGPCVDLFVPSSHMSIHETGYITASSTSASAAFFTGFLAKSLQCGLQKSELRQQLINNHIN